jgi:hypothetical protein
LYPPQKIQIPDQVAAVLSLAGDNPEFLYREGQNGGEILIRVRAGRSGKIKWENHYEIPDPEKGKIQYIMTYRRDA